MSTPRPSPRSFRLIVVSLVAMVGLSACMSTPSAKRVALDVVETLEVSEAVKACMRDAIREYDRDDLQDIADAVDSGDSDGLADLATFEASLRTCRAAG